MLFSVSESLYRWWLHHSDSENQDCEQTNPKSQVLQSFKKIVQPRSLAVVWRDLINYGKSGWEQSKEQAHKRIFGRRLREWRESELESDGEGIQHDSSGVPVDQIWNSHDAPAPSLSWWEEVEINQNYCSLLCSLLFARIRSLGFRWEIFFFQKLALLSSSIFILTRAFNVEKKL